MGLLKKILPVIPFLLASLATIVPLGTIGIAIAFFEINDYPEYFAAARMIMDGQGSAIYDVPKLFAVEHQYFPTRQAQVGFFLPPWAAPFILPLAVVPVFLAKYLWPAFLFLFLPLSTIVLKRLFQLRAKGAAWLWNVMSLYAPTYEALRIGQLSPIFLFVISISAKLIQSGELALAGFALSTLSVKPQILLPITIFLLGVRRYRLFFVILGFCILYLLLSIFLLGPGIIQSYIHTVGDPANLPLMQPELNPTLRGQLLRFASPYATVAAIAFLLSSLLFIFFLGRRVASSNAWVNALLMVVLPLGAVSSLHCHSYDLLVLIPGILAMCRAPFAKRFPAVLQLIAFPALGVFMIPFAIYIHYDYLMKGGVINPMFVILFLYSLFISVVVWKHSSELETIPDSVPTAGSET